MAHQPLPCRGCKDATPEKDCVIAKFRHAYQCPCRDCLVKGICTDPCDEYHYVKRQPFQMKRRRKVWQKTSYRAAKGV